MASEIIAPKDLVVSILRAREYIATVAKELVMVRLFWLIWLAYYNYKSPYKGGQEGHCESLKMLPTALEMEKNVMTQRVWLASRS